MYAIRSYYAEQYVNDVLAKFPDRSTPILTMCRTGYRSVLAANLLADAGYTNVRNIWQGFVGNTKVRITSYNVCYTKLLRTLQLR